MTKKKITEHYKSYFGIQDISDHSLGKSDKAMIEWATVLLEEAQTKSQKSSIPPVGEIELLMEFDVWISARFGQEYKIEESKEIMEKFLSSR